MRIPTIPMVITMTAIAKKTATAATISNNLDPHPILAIIAPFDSKLLYISPAHVQPMLRPRSKTTGLVLPPHAPTCTVLSFPPPPPCARFVTAAIVVAGLTLPSAWRHMLVRSSLSVQME
uniref:Uncharacterized protein n=1 Tax=Romanomermis culicivorax TaxID=13658 RepID=A0A915KQU5_ROMCU